MIRTVIIDDQILVLEGLRKVFSRTEDISVVSVFEDGDEFLRASLTRRDADVVVLDLAMARTGGFSVLKELQERANSPPVLVFTNYRDPDLLRRTRKAGARGYLTKTTEEATLYSAVRHLAAGGSWFDGEE